MQSRGSPQIHEMVNKDSRLFQLWKAHSSHIVTKIKHHENNHIETHPQEISDATAKN